MPIRNGYHAGLHLVSCDRCSNTYYSNQVEKEWNGLLVCKGAGTRDCWEPRQIIDSFRSRPDDSSVEIVSPLTMTDVYGNDPNIFGYTEGTYWIVGYTL